MNLPLESLRIDGGTQPRASINQFVVDDYAEAMQGGAQFPPVVVFCDGADYWLADGYHRYHAAKLAGLTTIDADIRQGTQREAVLFSAGANATHGLRRTNEDKRRSVTTLLNDSEWRKRSDRWIAEQCKVSARLVSELRIPAVDAGPRLGMDGKTRSLPQENTELTAGPDEGVVIPFGKMSLVQFIWCRLKSINPDIELCPGGHPGLELPEDMPFEQWQAVGKVLGEWEAINPPEDKPRYRPAVPRKSRRAEPLALAGTKEISR